MEENTIPTPSPTEDHTQTHTPVTEVPYHPIFPGNKFENIESRTIVMPTLLVVGILVLAFFILKIFIYTKDEKKHGK